MIEKRRRITRKTFTFDPKQRSVLFGKFLTMTQYSDNTMSVCCFTVTVSKKISKKATERNYLKRTVYEAVKNHTEAFDRKFSGNILFSFKKTPNIPLFEKINDDIQFFLNK